MSKPEAKGYANHLDDIGISIDDVGVVEFIRLVELSVEFSVELSVEFCVGISVVGRFLSLLHRPPWVVFRIQSIRPKVGIKYET